MIASARLDSLQLTMPGRRVTKTTSRQAGRCLKKPATTWRRWGPFCQEWRPSTNIGDTSGQGNWQNASLFVPRSARKSDDAPRSFTPPSMRSKTDRNIADLSVLTPLPDGLFVSKAKATSQP